MFLLNYEDSSALTSVDLQAMSLPPLPNDRSSTWLRMFFTAFRKLDALVGRRFIFQIYIVSLLFGGNSLFIRKEIPIEKKCKDQGSPEAISSRTLLRKGPNSGSHRSPALGRSIIEGDEGQLGQLLVQLDFTHTYPA
jgi:hypothetical protein